MAEILRFRQNMPVGGVPMYASDWPLLQEQMLLSSLTLYSSLSPDMIISGMVPTLSTMGNVYITGISEGYVLLGGDLYEFLSPASIPPSTSVAYIVIDETAGAGTKTAEYKNRTVKIGAASSPVLEVKKATVVYSQPVSGPYIKFDPFPSTTSSFSGTTFNSPLRPVYLSDLIAFHSKKRGEIVPFVGSLKGPGNIDLFSSTGLGLYSFRGFALCNGNNGTANLQGRFLVGTGLYTENQVQGTVSTPVSYSYSLGSTNVNGSGEARHKLTVDEMPRHSHGLNGDRFLINSDTVGSSLKDSGGDAVDSGARVSDGISNTGSNFYHENRPPFYAVNYLQKIS